MYKYVLLLTKLVFTSFICVIAQGAWATDVPASFTLDGELFANATGTAPLLDSSIGMKIQILDDDRVCVLYEENQSVNTVFSKGYFSVQVGTANLDAKRTVNDSGNAMATIFQNIASVSGRNLSDGSACTAAAVGGRRRYVRITITPASLGGAPRVLSPDLPIDSVPNAIVAERAESLQGFRGTDFIKVNTASGSVLSQTNLESLFTSSTRFNALSAMIDGTSTTYMRTTAGGAHLPVFNGAPTAPVQGSVWFDNSDQKMKYRTSSTTEILGSGSGSVSSVGLTAPVELSVAGAPVTSSGTIALTWANQTTGKVFASPNGSSGAPTFRPLVAADIPALGYITNAGGTPSIQTGLDAGKPAASVAGRIYFASDTAKIYQDTGAAWTLVGAGTGGTVTSVSSANSYLSVATGTTTPALTLNVGTAANTVAAGNDSRITGALQSATSFTGDVSGVYSATSVDKIKGTGVAITSITSGNFLTYNGTNWINSMLSAGDVTTALTYTPVNKAGDTMTGPLVLSADPSNVLGASTKQYVDSSTSTAAANYLRKDGTVALTADWDADGAGAGTRKISGLADPTASDGAATKNYADTKFITKTLPAAPAVGQNGQSIRWNNATPAWEYYTPSTGTGSGDFLADGSIPMTGSLKMGGQTINGSSTASGNLTLDSTSNATKGNIVLAPTGGNVGIGTATPGSELEVVDGEIGVISGTRDPIITLWSQNATYTPRVSLLLNRTNGTTSPQLNDVLGEITFGSVNGAAAQIIGVATENQNASQRGGLLAFYTVPNTTGTSIERMRINQNGNVGIGTTVPSTLLDVNGAATFRATAPPSAVAAQGKIYFDTVTNKFKVSENGGGFVDLIGGGGTVTSVTSANSYLTVATGTTTPALTLNVGTAANTVAAGNDSRITGALQSATAFTGDVSGAYNATSVDKIKGTDVAITTITSGNFLKYNGTNWINSMLSAGDVTTALTYTPINKAGDTMTGLLVLSADPSGALGASTKQYVDSSTSTAAANYLRKDGTVALTADWDADGAGAGTRKISGLADPTASDGAATKNYTDTKFMTKALPAAPAAGQNGQSLRWNNTTPAWEFYTPGAGIGDFLADGSIPMTGSLKMGGQTINGNSTANGNLTLDSTSNATKGYVLLAPSGGNVGIGTSAPTSKFTVNTPTTSDVSAVAMITNASGASKALVIQGNSTHGGSLTQWQNSTGATILRVTPYGALVAEDDNHEFGIWDTNIAGGTTVGLSAEADTYITSGNSSASPYNIILKPSGAGKVGIGTTAPSTLLDVNGAATFRATTAPSAVAAQGKIYFDTGTNKFKVSENGGGFVDLVGGGATGTVTSVSSANSYLSVATGTTTPALTLNVGTAANTVAAGNDSRITGALQAATAFTGDVSGVYSATSVDKIKGTGVAITSITSGNFLKYNGTNWINSMLSAGDVTTALTYTPVNKAGDTMTGLLVLSADPSGVLGASTKQYVDSSTSTAAANYLRKDATVALTADWDADGAGAGTRKISGLADPTASDGAATKNYADTRFMTKTLPAAPAVGQNGQSLRWNNTTPAWEFYTPYAGGSGDFLADGTVPMTGSLKMGGQTINGNSTASGDLTLDSTSNATKGNIVLAPTGGNVGIGTTSPNTLLEVSKNQDAETAVRVSNTSAGTTAYAAFVAKNDASTGYAEFGVGGTGFTPASSMYLDKAYMNAGAGLQGIVLTTEVATPIVFAPNMTERLRITSAGNVGIGTTAPSVKIDVQDTDADTAISVANLSSSSNHFPSMKIINYNGAQTGYPMIHFANMRGNSGSPSAVTSGDALGAILFNGGKDTSYGWGAGAQIAAYATQNYTGTNTGGALVMQTTANNTTSLVERMRVDQNGNVGIATAAPGEKLEVNGNVKAINFISTSDARLKTQIEPSRGLAAISKLRGVHYVWKNSGEGDAGVLAQEVEKVFPDAVRTDAETGLKGVKYQYLFAPLIEGVKELYEMVKSLKVQSESATREIASVKTDVDQQQTELSNLKNQNSRIKQENEMLKKRLELIEKKLGL